MLTLRLVVRWMSLVDLELHSRNVSSGISSNHYIDLYCSWVCAEMGVFCFSRRHRNSPLRFVADGSVKAGLIDP